MKSPLSLYIFLLLLAPTHIFATPTPIPINISTDAASPDGLGHGGTGGGGGAGGDNIINSILLAVGNLPGIGGAIDTLSAGLTTLEQGLATALGIQTEEDQLSCAAMSVIFARGTTEPGNVGVLTGPEFFTALEATVGAQNVVVQGVDYSASIDGFLEGGDPAGSQTMASLVQSVVSQCPNTKVVMSGYSQGGQLVHNAAKLLPAATMARVSSVVIFGDPDNGQPVVGASSAKTLVICHDGDNICQHGDLILLPHLTYSENAQQAATFVSAQAGLVLGSN